MCGQNSCTLQNKPVFNFHMMDKNKVNLMPQAVHRAVWGEALDPIGGPGWSWRARAQKDLSASVWAVANHPKFLPDKYTIHAKSSRIDRNFRTSDNQNLMKSWLPPFMTMLILNPKVGIISRTCNNANRRSLKF